MTKSFSHFVGIDWSGAKGKRHAGIAVALCEAVTGETNLIYPPNGKRYWSREGCMTWLAAGCGLTEGATVLVGFDSAFSMPFIDEGSYLPKLKAVNSAKQMWHIVESHNRQNKDFFGGGFVEVHPEHYLRTGMRGQLFKRRMRITEDLAVSTGAGPCESVFHLIGPSQVGLSGLSSMRMLAQLDDHEGIAIWPYDTLTTASIVIAEIYAASFATLGGHKGKIRDLETLVSILANLNAEIDVRPDATFSDHACDALVTAAGLRQIASDEQYWNPPELSSMVRRTEGWIFGIK